ncbi:hypothetical protein [Mariniflexile sp.]|uniref:hypothetical protein n=1 Tax=Mariniflexile sp. TaxID=1979402 RepID=UPI004047480A
MKKLITLCLLIATTFTVKAQEANLEETFTFIKLKTLDRGFWFTKATNITYSGCNGRIYYFIDKVNNMDLYVTSKKLVIDFKCDDKDGKLSINLENIESIENTPSNEILLSSSKPLFDVAFEGKNIETNSKFFILLTFNKETNDAERVSKAFKHLLKLLNIKLIQSKF